METTIQRIKKQYKSDFDIAKKYYKILFELNNIRITDKELNLVAFSAINGTISTPPVRDEFMKQFKTPIAYIYNMSSKLQKLNILVKDQDDKIRVNPTILPDFKKDLLLILKIDHETAN